MLLLALIAFWLWTPDKDRADLEARYLQSPSDIIEIAGVRLTRGAKRNALSDGLILALRDGNLKEVTACLKKARSEFKALDRVQDTALQFAHETIAHKRAAEED